MIKTSDYFRVPFVLSILLVCSEFGAFAKDIDLKPVVATVDGVEISSATIDSRKRVFSEITADKKNLTDKELGDLIIAADKESLARHIRILIRAEKIKELGLTVSKKELETESDKLLSTLTEEDKVKANKKLQALIIALDEVLKDPSASDRIYQKELSGLMIKQEWEDRVKYNTPEELAKLKKAVPIDLGKSKAYMMQHGSPTEGSLLERKLTETITKDITVSDEELTNYLVKERNINNLGPDKEKYRQSYRAELLEKKKRVAMYVWWQAAYKKADIRILDDKFKDVLISFKQ